MKVLLTIALYGVLVGLLATRPRDDDIDIYLAAGLTGDSCAPPTAFEDAVGPVPPLVAGALVANVPEQGSSSGDIFLPLFQPEPWPLWPGNIKKLKLVRRSGAAALSAGGAGVQVTGQAPAGQPALSVDDGHILPEVLSFWTDPWGADVQAFDPARREIPGRDGRSVTRGGAGQQIPGFLSGSVGARNSDVSARQVFTLDPDVPGELLALDATPSTFVALAPRLDPAGSLSPAEGLGLLRWVRGQDSYDLDGSGNREEPRPWLLGDVLHSRPLAISYGARPGTAYHAGNPDIRIFFGTNDGVLHILRNTAPSGDESGQESWAFLPPELSGMQHDLARNLTRAGQAHPYGLDGEAVAVIEDRDRDGNIELADGDTVRVVIGQRRGGRALFAFDMSDPDSPRYLWTINHRTPGFGQLGLTFSTPRVARLAPGGAAPISVLVFAGGYHGGWSGTDRVGKDAGSGSDPIGNAIYVVNPVDGSLIWRAVGPGDAPVPTSSNSLFYAATLTDSLPSPVTVIDSDHNGVDDRAYVGDSGGNVWRIDFTEQGDSDPGNAAMAKWSVRRLASLGGSAESDRRFFHAPDVVQSRDAAGEYDGVLIVSGNRALPGETGVNNFAYLLKDRATAGAAEGTTSALMSAIGHEELADITSACSTAGQASCIATNLTPGWKLELQLPGEKGLSTPLVSNGKVLFTSYAPAAGNAKGDTGTLCGKSAGLSRVYGVALKDGSPALPVPGQLEAGGAEPVPGREASRFQETGPGLQGGVVPYYDQVLLPGRGVAGESLLALSGRTRWRTYWRQDGVDTP